ncbi:MAG: helix-turn-helix transcriptional regulator [Clostridia bacterium]|nr:helix-turn-helix transcriptional regulator [Clostridia bacterium]
MAYDAEIGFLCRLMDKYGVQVLRFPRNAPPQIDLGLRANIHLINLNSDFFANMAHRTLYAIDDALLCHYNTLLLPDTSEVLLIGPYLTQDVTEQTILHLMDKHRLPSGALPILTHYYQQLPVIIVNDTMMLGLINTLAETLWGGDCAFETEYLENTKLSEITHSEDPAYLSKIMDAADLKLMEARYEAENRLMYAVSHGQTHQAQMMISRASEHVMEQRTMDSLRNIKNYGIILNVLLRKAAEEGSVHPLHIDQLSSTMARRLEQLRSPADALKLFSTMVHKYCLLVKNHSMKNYSQLVQHVILRIDADLTADLSLKSHADFLNVNPSYLSTLFKRETGMTLTDYVNRQRVEHGIFLLNATDMQIQTIAQYCGIPDVNYFTKTFKKFIGKTPKEYRQDIRGR